MHNPVSRPPTTEYTTFLLLYVVRILGMLLALSGVCMTLYGLYQLIHLHHNSMFLLISAIVTLLTIRIAWLACQDVVLFSHPVDSISSIETMQLKALNHNTMSSLPSSVLAPAQAFSQETVEAPLSFHMQQTSVLPAAHATSTPKPFQLPEYNWSHALLEPVYPDLTSRPDRDSVIGQLDIPYEPIEQDAIFQLDTSVGVRCLMLPKEGEPLVECQDRYALDDSQRCYALADGVSNSFVPGPWARIVTKRFVECGGQLDNDAFFRQWLEECSQEWNSWIDDRWVPTMNALRRHNGNAPMDWQNDIRKGAQTTLIGCTLHSVVTRRGYEWKAEVFSIGDCEYFLFRPDARYEWLPVHAFPYTTPESFGVHPHTLVTRTRPELVARSLSYSQRVTFSVQPDDLIVLVSDSLAKWFLIQLRQEGQQWKQLLHASPLHAFEPYIREAQHHGSLEDDDITMLAITVPPLEKEPV